MGIQSVINRLCIRKAVYWGNPQQGGSGDFTYDAPVEIDCRWENRNQLLIEDKGDQLGARGIIYLTQDVDERGMIYLGTLDSLYDLIEFDSSAGALDDPQEVPGALMIKQFSKIPALHSTTEFIRKAYLSKWYQM